MGLNFLYGTAWKEDETKECVLNALKAGYRGIDTANQRKHYHEAGVGEALSEAYTTLSLERSDLFLQTKFTYLAGQDERLPYDPAASYGEQVMQSFKSSLEHLKTDYLDSYILHGPFSGVGITEEDKQVWDAMEELYHQGGVKNIGVSNVSIEQLVDLYAYAKVKPKFAQIRTFAIRNWEILHREFCRENNITFQGFSLLTANRDFLGGGIIQNPGELRKLVFNPETPGQQNFMEIIKETGKTPQQVIFKFCHQLGILPITGTTNPENMAMNLDIDDFELTPIQLEQIENIAFNDQPTSSKREH